VQNSSPQRRRNPPLNPPRRRLRMSAVALTAVLLASGGPDAQCSPGHDAGYGGSYSCPDGYKRKTHLFGEPTCEKQRPPGPRPVPRETL